MLFVPSSLADESTRVALIVPPAVTVIAPSAVSIELRLMALVSVIVTSPLPLTEADKLVALVSRALVVVPMPVFVEIVINAALPEASMSTPPLSPASSSPPEVLLRVMADAVLLVLTKRDRVMFSSDDNVAVPVDTLMEEPSVNLSSPPAPLASASLSAVSTTFPPLVFRLPAALNVRSLSASAVNVPPPVVTAAWI